MSIVHFLRKMRVAATPRSWLLKSRLANGALVCGKNRPGYGGRGVYVFRDSLEPEFEQLDKLLDASGVFVDIGANTGIYTLKAAKHSMGKGGQVLAVEPFPDVLATLHYNIQLNGFNHVRLRNFCMGEKTCSAEFWMNYGKPHSFSLVKRDENARCFSTLVVALDDLFVWEGLDRLDYIKIDAEGAEEQILLGARKTLSKYRPIIQMEVSINDAPFVLQDYSTFQARSGMNKVYVPNESSKLGVPQELGWTRVS
jgi:FkbM family methyltransferase